MVIGSPALRLVRVHPARVIHKGLYNSIVQCSTSPLSFLASKCRRQCGLFQSRLVTVPSSVIDLDISYAVFCLKKKITLGAIASSAARGQPAITVAFVAFIAVLIVMFIAIVI